MQPDQYQQYTQPPVEPVQYPAASAPKKHAWVLIISLVITVLLLLGTATFAIWAYASRGDYKENSDKKAALAVAVAVKNEGTKKDNEFLEREKSPFKSYQGPGAYGSLFIEYPKTWAAYVVESDKAATPVKGYFHPNFVPDVLGATAFALHIEVSSQTYDQEMKQFESKVKSGKVTVAPFVPKNVPSVTGARVEGEINQGQKATMVLLPLRDRTIKISTQSQQFINDFNTTILTKFKFTP